MLLLCFAFVFMKKKKNLFFMIHIKKGIDYNNRRNKGIYIKKKKREKE